MIYIEQLELILADFAMDMEVPANHSLKKIRSFKRDSYSLWAVDELYTYIERNLYPRDYGSIEDILDITREFIQKMNRYAKANKNNSDIFYTAGEVSEDILELLSAMQ